MNFIPLEPLFFKNRYFHFYNKTNITFVYFWYQKQVLHTPIVQMEFKTENEIYKNEYKNARNWQKSPGVSKSAAKNI